MVHDPIFEALGINSEVFKKIPSSLFYSIFFNIIILYIPIHTIHIKMVVAILINSCYIMGRKDSLKISLCVSSWTNVKTFTVTGSAIKIEPTMTHLSIFYL